MIIKTHFFLITALLLLNYSCKTQEQIQREKMVDDMSHQLMQNQKISAQSNVDLQDIKDNLTTLQGKMEELEHNSSAKSDETQKDMIDRFTLLIASNKALNEEVLQLKGNQTKLSDKVDRQEKFIQSVLSSLKKMGGPTRKRKSKSKLSLFDQAMKSYKRGKYKKASIKLQGLFDSSSLRGTKKAHVMHNLAMSYYIRSKNQKALLYFSKLFTEFPKSSFNKNGLYHLALTFKRLKKNNEYKQTLKELISRFPKSKMAKKARKLIK